MQPLIQLIENPPEPERVARLLGPEVNPIFLKSGGPIAAQTRYSILTGNPFLIFESHGAQCEWHTPGQVKTTVQFGNPWKLMADQMARCELPDEPDAPFPTGGCFGYWGYDLKQFVEPRVSRRAINDLDFPDCRLGFYPTLLIWDRHMDRAWIVATGLAPDGSRSRSKAQSELDSWLELLDLAADSPSESPVQVPAWPEANCFRSSTSREGFIKTVHRALEYIRLGHIYQVNLSQRWSQESTDDPWRIFERLSAISPAPFSACQRWSDRAVICSSPEQFLKFSANEVVTRPIKGTRPRSMEPDEDTRLSYELLTSEKERAELVMITDLLRNDLGRVCDFGSISVPELMRLERYSHVQHLVSTIRGSLRTGTTHIDALAACFPGGSITGAPKVRAMQIIDELEPVARGPYTGCLGYLGFNRESQLNIVIRTALVSGGHIHYHAGAGIVADSNPDAEFEETLVKARAFFQSVLPASISNAMPGLNVHSGSK